MVLILCTKYSSEVDKKIGVRTSCFVQQYERYDEFLYDDCDIEYGLEV